MINEWQTLWCNNVYECAPLIRQRGQREWMARDSLAPFTTLYFPDPIFHFHLNKQTHATAYNIPQIPCIPQTLDMEKPTKWTT